MHRLSGGGIIRYERRGDVQCSRFVVVTWWLPGGWCLQASTAVPVGCALCGCGALSGTSFQLGQHVVVCVRLLVISCCICGELSSLPHYGLVFYSAMNDTHGTHGKQQNMCKLQNSVTTRCHIRLAWRAVLLNICIARTCMCDAGHAGGLYLIQPYLREGWV